MVHTSTFYIPGIIDYKKHQNIGLNKVTQASGFRPTLEITRDKVKISYKRTGLRGRVTSL